MTEVSIETEIIKLDSFLKWSGALSMGSEAKFFIQNGDVKVNKEVCTQRSKKLRKGDIIEFNQETYKLI